VEQPRAWFGTFCKKRQEGKRKELVETGKNIRTGHCTTGEKEESPVCTVGTYVKPVQVSNKSQVAEEIRSTIATTIMGGGGAPLNNKKGPRRKEEKKKVSNEIKENRKQKEKRSRGSLLTDYT